jgi:phytoene desaturase
VLKVQESYWGIVSRFFKSQKLRFAFTFEAMFMGVSPYQAPGFYSIISYTDHAQKIRHPMGGMYAIPQALERMAREFGAGFHYDEEVRSLKANASCVLKTGRDSYRADYAVVNADYPYAQTDLLGERIPSYKYSCSVYLLYWGVKKKVPGLAHHNLFFSGDLQKNLRQIFQGKQIPDDPSFYIHVPTLTDPSLAPPGCDIIYTLIPVPNLQGGAEAIAPHEDRLRKMVLDAMSSRILQ